MDYKIERYLKTLELDKILNMLAEEASLAVSLCLQPADDTAKTSAATMQSTFFIKIKRSFISAPPDNYYNLIIYCLFRVVNKPNVLSFPIFLSKRLCSK